MLAKDDRMIIIRPIRQSEIPFAVRMKIECWTEELAGMAENTMSFEEELSYWTKWVSQGEEINDVRLFLGAFVDGELAGFISVCFAQICDIPRNGIELNSLAVEKSYRGKRISLYLILAALNYYIPLGARQIVIYSHHFAPSNTYYISLGAGLLRQENRKNGNLIVDVFIIDILNLQRTIEKKIRKKSSIGL